MFQTKKHRLANACPPAVEGCWISPLFCPFLLRPGIFSPANSDKAGILPMRLVWQTLQFVPYVDVLAVYMRTPDVHVTFSRAGAFL